MNIPVNVKVGKEKDKPVDLQHKSDLSEEQLRLIGLGLFAGAALVGFAVGRHTGMKAGIKVGQKMGYAAGQLETFRIISAAIK